MRIEVVEALTQDQMNEFIKEKKPDEVRDFCPRITPEYRNDGRGTYLAQNYYTYTATFYWKEDGR